jgi:predicted metal-dependent hydrolase
MQKIFDYGVQQVSVSEEDARKDWSPGKLKWFCSSILQAAFPAFRDVDMDAHFYPYVGLTHTLRRRKSGWTLRISDHCRSAPAEVVESVVRILAYKVMRKKPPRKTLRVYELFRQDPLIEAAVRNRRLRKGRKQFSDEAGKFHSLRDIYDELNERYFNRQIEVNRIGWGLRKSRSRLGHYDPIHHTITLSPALDSPDVPSYVVRYIVYHEMLHAVFGDTPVSGARKHHPREFRRTESAYPDFAGAKKFLSKFSSRRGRVS